MEREERRTVEDADRVRGELITLTRVGTIGQLAGLSETNRALKISGALANLLACAKRAWELQREREELTSA